MPVSALASAVAVRPENGRGRRSELGIDPKSLVEMEGAYGANLVARPARRRGVSAARSRSNWLVVSR